MTPNLPYNGTSSPRTTRTDCDHLKTHMRRYFFNLTNGIRTVVDADGVQRGLADHLCGVALRWPYWTVSLPPLRRVPRRD